MAGTIKLKDEECTLDVRIRIATQEDLDQFAEDCPRCGGSGWMPPEGDTVAACTYGCDENGKIHPGNTVDGALAIEVGRLDGRGWELIAITNEYGTATQAGYLEVDVQKTIEPLAELVSNLWAELMQS